MQTYPFYIHTYVHTYSHTYIPTYIPTHIYSFLDAFAYGFPFTNHVGKSILILTYASILILLHFMLAHTLIATHEHFTMS